MNINRLFKIGDRVGFPSRIQLNLSNQFTEISHHGDITDIMGDTVLVSGKTIPMNHIKTINGMSVGRMVRSSSVAIDMDGVLVDFDQGVRNTTDINIDMLGNHSVRHTDEYRDETARLNDFLATVDDEWWANLPPMFEAKTLYNTLKNHFESFFILTAYQHDRRNIEACVEGKKKWLSKNIHLKTTKENFVACESVDKQKYIGHKGTEFSFLVDDRADNVRRWIDHGGLAIKHTDTKTTLGYLKDM